MGHGVLGTASELPTERHHLRAIFKRLLIDSVVHFRIVGACMWTPLQTVTLCTLQNVNVLPLVSFWCCVLLMPGGSGAEGRSTFRHIKSKQHKACRPQN